MDKVKKEMSTTQVILVGFLLAIVIGAVLLSMPFSSADGRFTPFIDALFTSTTSVCVTGLVVVNTFEYWSTIGQIIILLLIQCGGLGIVSIATIFTILIGQKVTLKGKLLIEDALNLKTMAGLSTFLKFVFKGTFLIEGIGAIAYMFVFVPEFGPKGIWISIFTSVSAFCNAGIDIIGPSSLAPYVGNWWINIITMLLIVLSGLGFIVWYDFARVIKLRKEHKLTVKDTFIRLSLHSKIVLITTGCLLSTSALAVFAMEFTNPETLGTLSFSNKILASMFQAVTLRTAGFLTVSQKGLRDCTALFCILMMFIGGSPTGTAGGVKTTTVAMIFLAALASAKGREDVVIFKRTIPLSTVRKGIAVVFFSMLVIFGAIILLLAFNGGEFVDVCFEAVSAIGTVGLSRDFTSSLNQAGKIIVICCMYLGRVGPISMATAFGKKKDTGVLVKYAKEDITVG